MQAEKLINRLKRLLEPLERTFCRYDVARAELEGGADLLQTKNVADNVEGWLADIEGTLLYNLARKCAGRGMVVEIGSYKGKSTIFLGAGSKAGKKVKVYAIDPHRGTPWQKKLGPKGSFDEFRSNVENAHVDDVVVPVVKTSEEAAGNCLEPCELIFVDGCHEFSFVKKDFELWYPKLVDGGIMAFHDTLHKEGPRQLVRDSLYKSKRFKNVGFARSIVYGEKVRCNKLRDRIRNRYYLLLNDVYRVVLRVGFTIGDILRAVFTIAGK
jgi:predicted O-methyltransferase YrrM